MPNDTGNPYFDSSSSNIDEGKAALLKAVAENGTAGKQAFQQAQASIAAGRQASMGRAAQRAALSGNAASALNPSVTEGYDSRAGQLTQNQAGFEANLAGTSASGQSYLEKARASIPVLQAINSNKMTQQKATLDAAVAVAQAKAQAAAEAAQATADRADARSQASSDRADARAAKTAAGKAAKPPTFDQIMGTTRQINDTVNQGGPESMDPNSAGNDPRMVDAILAAGHTPGGLPNAVGQGIFGLNPAQANSILTPQKTNAYNKAVAPPPSPDEKALMTVPGVDNKVARTILADPQYQSAITVANGIANMQIDPSTGTVVSSGASNGLTPWQVFAAWMADNNNLGQQKGRTKLALEKTYKPYLDALSGK